MAHRTGLVTHLVLPFANWISGWGHSQRLRLALVSQGGLCSRGLESGSPPLLISSHIPPPPTCVTETSRVPFLQLLSLQKFVKAKVLDRMLGKGAVEVVKNPRTGYYSWFFLVQKALWGWRQAFDFESQQVPQIFCIEWGYIPTKTIM